MRLVLLAVLPSLVISQYRDLTNITEAVFGRSPSNRSFIPAAFGDFNSDKLTDLIVLTDRQKTVAVLLATEQKVVSSGNDPPLFIAHPNANLECNAPEGKIVSAMPADFDGDGGMDLVIVTRKVERIQVWVIWGSQAGLSSLDCDGRIKVELTYSTNQTKQFGSEPLVVDYNRDYIADLVTVTEDGDRVVIVFTLTRTYTLTVLDSKGHRDQMKKEHSSAFIDLSGDGAADLVLTTQTGLEMYQSTGKGFEFHSFVSWPSLGDGCDVDQCLGQTSFADFDLDGHLNLLLPICFDPLCSNSSLVQVSVANLWKWEEGVHHWTAMSLELGPFRFLPPNPRKSPLRLMSPRLGDVDLDGFPDLLMTVYNTSLGSTAIETPQTVLLLNVPCGDLSGCHPYWRQFQVQPAFTQDTGPSIAAAFFDLYEDGKSDILLVDDDDTSSSVTAWTNTTQNSDAYFIKVIVLSGACYHNCPNHSSKYVPYGTNSGGQVISYTSQRAGPEVFASYSSVAAQMTQTSHFALQLPYTIFGLGLAPNFVDYMWVNISASRSHTWPQIIPNSQLYVIPYPPNRPEEWEAKLIIFTSKNIVITGLSMVGVCVFVSCIIVALHLRERRLDHQAKLQEAHRFHFDAM